MSEPPGSMAALNGVHELTAATAPGEARSATRTHQAARNEPR
jgi:hypothetical protein